MLLLYFVGALLCAYAQALPLDDSTAQGDAGVRITPLPTVATLRRAYILPVCDSPLNGKGNATSALTSVDLLRPELYSGGQGSPLPPQTRIVYEWELPIELWMTNSQLSRRASMAMDAVQHTSGLLSRWRLSASNMLAERVGPFLMRDANQIEAYAAVALPATAAGCLLLPGAEIAVADNSSKSHTSESEDNSAPSAGVAQGQVELQAKWSALFGGHSCLLESHTNVTAAVTCLPESLKNSEQPPQWSVVPLLNAADEFGLVQGSLRVNLTEPMPAELQYAAALGTPVAGVVPFGASVSANVLLAAPAGFAVISDIDDTIKDSNVLNKMALARNTFLRDWAPVTGMSLVYQHWAQRQLVVQAPRTVGSSDVRFPLAPGTPIAPTFHYISGSPQPLYAPLEEFLSKNGFPSGTLQLRSYSLYGSLSLKRFGPSTNTTEHKRVLTSSLIERMPGRRFVLVGDSTERDPETYGDLARTFPAAIQCIFIRRVAEKSSDSSSDSQRSESSGPGAEIGAKIRGGARRLLFRSVAAEDPQARFIRAFEGVPAEKWFVFDSVADLAAVRVENGECRPTQQVSTPASSVASSDAATGATLVNSSALPVVAASDPSAAGASRSEPTASLVAGTPYTRWLYELKKFARMVSNEIANSASRIRRVLATWIKRVHARSAQAAAPTDS